MLPNTDKPLRKRRKPATEPLVKKEDASPTTLAEDIAAGKVDDQLRAIVRACYARRTKLKQDAGKPMGVAMVCDGFNEFTLELLQLGVAQDETKFQKWLSTKQTITEKTESITTCDGSVPPSPAPPPAAASGGPQQTMHVVTVGGKSYPDTGITIAPGGLLPRGLLPTSGRKLPVERWNGKSYLRSDIIGHRFVFPRDINPAALQTVSALIVGVGPSSFKVLLLNPPLNRRGKYYEHWRKDEPLFIPRNKMFNYLVRGRFTNTRKATT